MAYIYDRRLFVGGPQQYSGGPGITVSDSVATESDRSWEGLEY